MPRQVSYATWKQPLPRVEPQATVTPVRLDVHFAPDEGALNPDDQSAIDGFLAHNQITTGNSVALVVAPPGPGEGKLTASRVSAVQQNLESRGIMVESVLADAKRRARHSQRPRQGDKGSTPCLRRLQRAYPARQ